MFKWLFIQCPAAYNYWDFKKEKCFCRAQASETYASLKCYILLVREALKCKHLFPHSSSATASYFIWSHKKKCYKVKMKHFCLPCHYEPVTACSIKADNMLYTWLGFLLPFLSLSTSEHFKMQQNRLSFIFIWTLKGMQVHRKTFRKFRLKV